MKRLVRRKTLPDGRVEVFTPKMTDGYYTLADRAVDPKKHNTAANQFFVRDLEAVIARLKHGGVSLRMRGDITGQENLLSAGAIEIEDDRMAPSVAEDDDPFATFTEWNSAADDAAYKDL
ncbi:MAG TPA: hypothetical protein VIE16_04510 [Phenylobacterium sp.]